MQARLLNPIKQHALEVYPSESCGLIVLRDGKEEYVRCRNLVDDGESFVMDPRDYAKVDATGEILMFVHSHPDESAKPSEADLVTIEEQGMPAVIVSVYRDLVTEELVAEEYTITEPSGYVAPLIGRRWAPPKLDCYALIRDYYQRELDITLIDFEVVKRAGKWWENKENSSLYMDNFEEAGFVRVDDDPKEHDILIMEIGSVAGPNHAGIYLGDEAGYMLHHLCDRLSKRDVYGGYWLEHTRCIVRHKEMM